MFTRHYAVWPKGLPKHLPVPQTSLYENLAITARRYPTRDAIVYYDSRLSYCQLQDEVDALAGWLQQQGVKKGDRVLLYMQNCPQFVIGYYAILRADAVVVPVNPMSRTAELEHYVSDTGASVCLLGQELFAQAAKLQRPDALRTVLVTAYADYVRAPTTLALPDVVAQPPMALAGEGVYAWQAAISAALAPAPLQSGPQDIALMPYSSGTTGLPKGCVHTHHAVMTTTLHRIVWTQTVASSVVLA